MLARRWWIAILCTIASCAASADERGTKGIERKAFALDTTADQMLRHEVDDPFNTALLGPQTASFGALAFSPDRKTLWATTAQGALGTVDQATGAFTPLVDVVPEGSLSAMAIDPITGVFLVARIDGGTDFHTLDPATGQLILVAHLNDIEIESIAIGCDGVAYAIGDGADIKDGMTSLLYRIDVHAIGDGESIGQTSASLDAANLAIDHMDGTLYAWSRSGIDDSQYGRIDTIDAGYEPIANVDGRLEFTIRSACPAGAFGLFADGFEG